MKSILLTLLLGTSLSSSYGQKITKNEVDKFTKNTIKETSFEVLAMPFKNALRFSIRSVNDDIYIRFRVSLHQAFRIDEGDYAYLALENGTSIQLKCTKGGLADYLSGVGSLWVCDGSFEITKQDIEEIKQSRIIAARIDTGDYKVEFDKVKPKNDEKLKKALSLIQNTNK